MFFRTLTVASVLALLSLTSGCSNGSDSPDAKAGSSTTAAPAATGEGAASPDDVVAELVAQDSDAAAGESIEQRERGDEVDGQVTLDYCGFEFTSEASRTARRQVNVVADDRPVASSEAVLYEPGGAAKAMEEMRASVAECPDDLVDSAVEGVPALRYQSEPLAEDLLGDLAADHLAIDVTATDKAGTAIRQFLVLQHRGDALVATYAMSEDRVLALAGPAAERLAAAPAADIGA